jgi:hypothetical protein
MVGINLDANYIFCELMKKQNQGQDDHSLPMNGQQDEAHGTQVKTSSIRQQVF